MRVEGTDARASRHLEEFLAPFVGKAIDGKRLDRDLTRLSGIGKFSRVGYRLVREGGVLRPATWERSHDSRDSSSKQVHRSTKSMLSWGGSALMLGDDRAIAAQVGSSAADKNTAPRRPVVEREESAPPTQGAVTALRGT